MAALTSERSRVCPDCPGKRGVLEAVIDQPQGCAFRCVSVTAREPLPLSLRGAYGIALVRRGIVIRQRVDSQGRATAVDIVGPGSSFPVLPVDEDGSATGYAVDDTLLCLLSSSAFGAAIDGGKAAARAVVGAQASVLERVERIAEARSRASASARLGALLVTIADTLSDRRLDTVPAAIQQRDLALLVAMRHESVCRVLASFTRRGALARDPHGLRIVDRGALETA